MVFQNYAIFPHLTVRGNIAYGLRKNKLDKTETNRRVDDALEVIADDGLVGGILYYGNRNVEVLPHSQQVQSFLDRGGRYFILDRRKLPWLDPVGRFEVHATTRSSQREVAIVSRIP